MKKINYSELTDFEINKRVASRLYSQCCLDFLEDEGKVLLLHGNFIKTEINFIKDWADAGPIIEKHKINLKFYHYSKFWHADIWNHEETKNAQISPACRDKSPLRAAMILFLMIKGCME